MLAQIGQIITVRIRTSYGGRREAGQPNTSRRVEIAMRTRYGVGDDGKVISVNRVTPGRSRLTCYHW
jgi:hypothetical protein